MNKYEVTMGFQKLRDARRQWNTGRAEFNDGYSRVLRRLIHEGARAFMSAREMAQALDVPSKTVIRAMREAGLDPRSGKRNLSDAASKALVGNAELLGVDPNAFDLTSPLAYLPMGEQMRKEILTVSKVTDLDDDPNVTDEMDVECTHCGHTITVTL